MLSNAQEFNSLGTGGGFGGGWGNGLGGFGLFGLLGLKGIGDLDGRRNGDCDKPGVNELATLQAIQNAKDVTVASEANLRNAICDTEKTALQQFYAAAIQAQNNTQSIKDQATAFAIVQDKRFDDAATQAANNTAAILARINDVENQNLRDQLFEARRGRDVQDIKIENINTNSQLQAQLQAQAQVQTQRDFDHIRRFDSIFGSFNQLNRNTQDVINFGTMAASANQANQQTTIK